jgi:hypothetical protein
VRFEVEEAANFWRLDRSECTLIRPVVLSAMKTSPVGAITSPVANAAFPILTAATGSARHRGAHPLTTGKACLCGD